VEAALERDTTGSSAPVPIPGHIDELDGIRGIAAILVVFHHISQSFPAEPSSQILRLWLALTHAGWLGVDIFFALSGFLITRVLLGSRGRPHYYKNFYARRLLRLAPPYLLTLMLVGLFVPHSLGFLGLSFVYLANFAVPLGVTMAYPPLWSLAVEEHFYLIWPWIVRYLHLRTIFVIGLLICLVTPLFRWEAQRHGFFYPYASWFQFDGLAWGALLAIQIAHPQSTRKRVMLWSYGVGLTGAILFVTCSAFGAMGRSSEVGSTFVFGLVAMATTGVIGTAALGSFRSLLSPLRHPVLRFLGDISYWVYLFHFFMVAESMRLLHTWHAGWPLYLAETSLVLFTSILTGVAVRRWIEIPALSLKKRFR
jgi:peptidoglycan/LPS O-acetylase OafA/YrhL